MAEAHRQRLIEREVRVATVERLIKRREAMLAKVADRRDQKNLDELAQRLSSARTHVGMG
jgi:flagellar biosynthesis chaperone FliJ